MALLFGKQLCKVAFCLRAFFTLLLLIEGKIVSVDSCGDETLMLTMCQNTPDNPHTCRCNGKLPLSACKKLSWFS